jgi:hypothetical protein
MNSVTMVSALSRNRSITENAPQNFPNRNDRHLQEARLLVRQAADQLTEDAQAMTVASAEALVTAPGPDPRALTPLYLAYPLPTSDLTRRVPPHLRTRGHPAVVSAEPREQATPRHGLRPSLST